MPLSADSIEVAVPLPGLSQGLSYSVPAALRRLVHVGARVEVPLAGRRVVGLVLGPAQPEPAEANPPDATTARRKLLPIKALVDDAPVVSPRQLELVRFVAQYYACGVGEAVRLVWPPDTKTALSRRFALTEVGERARVLWGSLGLTKRHVDALAVFAPGQRHGEAQLKKHGVSRALLDKLLQVGAVVEVAEESAAAPARTEELLVPLDGGEPLPARAQALAAFDAWLRVASSQAPVLLSAAQVAFPDARGKAKRLAALSRLRIDVRARGAPGRSSAPSGMAKDVATLTAEQTAALAVLTAGLDDGGAFLLEGVTGSGKTEVYLRAAKETLLRGRGVIFVVPEIALTPQLTARVERALRDVTDVAVIHSGLSAPLRRDALARIREGQARVVVGARSALFAPVAPLGLIVVDEEHEGSLKQDETPRYHARDVALWRAKNEGAAIVLGSATPSLESRHNAATGKLVHLRMPTRVGGGGLLPRVEVIDLRTRKQQKETSKRDRAADGPGVVLSAPLVTALRETLEAGDQALLFLNRRGFSTTVLCEACGEVRECPRCSVSLTLHGRPGVGRWVCHQCDHHEPSTLLCPSCGSDDLIALGTGTERVEAEVKAHFPDARVARVDRDTTARKGTLEALLSAVHAREIDVVIGTQMLAKGHDFPGVATVGVVNADVALHLPDFRAAERAFSLLTQVSGRAGRGDKAGRVLVQTYDPSQPAIVFAKDHDASGFAAEELQLRQALGYPPFSRLARVVVEAVDAGAAARLAHDLASHLRAQALPTLTLLGPAPAPLERIKDRTRFQMLLKTKSAAERSRALLALRAEAEAGQPSLPRDLARDLARARARLILDVDPIHML